MYLTYTICSNYQDATKVAYCVPNLHNMLTLPKCYQGSILLRAYCVGKVHNMLPWWYQIMGAYCVGKVHNMLPR